MRRDDAAHGLVLHVLLLRQQHRLRLKAADLRISASTALAVASTASSLRFDLLGSRIQPPR
jgi:hypothetical protein